MVKIDTQLKVHIISSSCCPDFSTQHNKTRHVRFPHCQGQLESVPDLFGNQIKQIQVLSKLFSLDANQDIIVLVTPAVRRSLVNNKRRNIKSLVKL